MSEIPGPEGIINHENENTPEKLAAEIKNEGMGYIMCYSFENFFKKPEHYLSPHYRDYGWTYVMGFAYGKDAINMSPRVLDIAGNPGVGKPIDYTDLNTGIERDWAFLARGPYKVPTKRNKYEIPVKGRFRTKKLEVEMEVPLEKSENFRGDNDWRAYYYNVTTAKSTPRSETCSFIFDIPPNLAQRLDHAIDDNPYFIDNTVKALYPGVIGTDPNTQLVRRPTKRLVICDTNLDQNGHIKRTQKIIELPHQYED